MREILFRGKRTDNGEWIEGYYAKQSNHSCFVHELKYTHFIFKDICLDFNLGGLQEFEVIPETVGQYTGLTDKNGKRIFAGDIVLYGTNTNRAKNKETHEVVFETRGGSGYFGIRISEIETWQFCLEVPAKLMEVIGNIHDNPELLKGDKGNGVTVQCVTDNNVGCKWISVEERLPKNFISVLGYMTDAGEFPPVRECYTVGNAFFFPALGDVHPVSHWCEIPKPPKGE